MPKGDHLTANDLLFINDYMANGRNGTEAYLKVHPFAKRESARAQAPIVLAKPCVQAEIAKRIKYSGGITKEFVTAGLLRACDLAEQSGDADKIERAYMSAAKLAGFLVEKHEEVTPKSPQPPELARDVRQLLEQRTN